MATIDDSRAQLRAKQRDSGTTHSSTWSPKQIEQRQERLANPGLKVWPRKPRGRPVSAR
jgi:hypothetical protein